MAGRRLEAARFGLYLSFPVFVSVVFANPNFMGNALSFFKYVVYPAESPRGQITSGPMRRD
eukprot:CAMPEP_0175965938 /NCGR_PEP_ID=MMETSP0108-20121206/38390_1 /TAXON_ID=195067 ORGANISM="Goniomonas pacifica, Strain CCMP1869" /NCGR_SAMPLE_ID=MMETSP0108 /ASSEMBLY_ACC=CAM_ASM_000204 /LENGTH=60 /DNA_ID=CAMNT_0017294077 /DNA_START=9 /DNA_END=191 /DNA_ORIENTATION=+